MVQASGWAKLLLFLARPFVSAKAVDKVCGMETTKVLRLAALAVWGRGLLLATRLGLIPALNQMPPPCTALQHSSRDKWQSPVLDLKLAAA